MPRAKHKIEAIDLFSGIGGLTFGLQQAGVKVIAGLDNDETCAAAYEKNNKSKFICADIAGYDFNEFDTLYSPHATRVLVGCAPCQPFSSHTFKVKDKSSDTRWNLIDYFVEAIKSSQPDIVSMENVRGVTKTDVFKNFVINLEELGYFVDYKVVYAPDYGIPQNRSRLVLLASKLGPIKVPNPTHTKKTYKKVQDVIKGLEPLKDGQVSENDRLHRSAKLSPLNRKRIRQSKRGGSWKDWDPELLPECFKRESGSSYTSVYGRMDWDEVAPTITTQFYNYGSGRFGHPEQNRAISLREGAMIQTFPPGYYFGENSFPRIARHIGNAVPPRLGYVIGKTIREHIQADS